MIRLSGILREVLDVSKAETYQLLTPGVKKPEGEKDMDPMVSKHTFTDRSTEAEYKWYFKNAKGKNMEVELVLQSEEGGDKPTLSLSFGKVATAGRDKYHTETGAGDLRAILATVLKAADLVIAAEGLGGRNGLYAISYSPSDERRNRIYKYFIQTYFPNFVHKRDTPGNSYKTFVNRNYGKREITEIGAKLGGEGSVKPFDSERMTKGDEEDPVKYKFKTDSGTVYRVYITKSVFMGTVDYEVAFGALTDSEYPDYSYEVNDMKSLFRVMATVIDVIKKEMEEDKKEERNERGELVKPGREVKSIQMEPSKRVIRQPGGSETHKFDTSDMRRYNLYRAYIEKNMPPGSKVNATEDGSVIRVDLPTEGE